MLAALALFAVDGLEDAAVIDIDFVVIAVENFLDSISEFMGDGIVFLLDVLCTIVVAHGDDDGGTEAESQYDGESCCCCHFDFCLIVIYFISVYLLFGV